MDDVCILYENTIMIRSIIITFLLGMNLLVSAQKQVTVSADIDRAIVFLNGAQLFHSAPVSIPSGPSEIIIQGLSQYLDQNSIQGGGTGNFTIMDIQYQLYYPEPVANTSELTKIDKKIKAIQDSMLMIDFQLKGLYAKKEVIDVQKTMLMNNRLLNTNSTDSLELIKNSVQYYEEKLQQLLTAGIENEKNQYYLNVERSAMQQRIYELQVYRNQQAQGVNPNAPIPQVVMQVFADAATSGTVRIDYLTNNAGWYATYDIRATDVAKPIDITYKANIWQTSGLDWKNVEITCSTGNPLLGNTLPQLTTWYLGYYQQYYQRDFEESLVAPAATDDVNEAVSKTITADSQGASYANQYTTVQPTLTNVEFDIALKYSIPSDGKGHIVALQTSQLTTYFNYLIVPKIEQSAFLIARITDWETLNLLPGNANLYFNNSYVGKTFLNPLALSDTLSLSMGRDKGIEVERKMVADKSSDRLIGLNEKKVMTYATKVRNGKSIPIEVIIMEHIPVSQVDDIEVELLEKSGGEIDEVTGFVTWREKLKPKADKSYTISFEITYPKNASLNL